MADEDELLGNQEENVAPVTGGDDTFPRLKPPTISPIKSSTPAARGTFIVAVHGGRH